LTANVVVSRKSALVWSTLHFHQRMGPGHSPAVIYERAPYLQFALMDHSLAFVMLWFAAT